MITIVDYKMGNIGSLVNMFHHIGEDVSVTNQPRDIIKSSKLVLPGVGAFDTAMHRIRAVPGLHEALDEAALIHQVPVLGICLGMQLLTESSEEGAEKGLGWIPGSVARFQQQTGIRIPHMGWNNVEILKSTPLTASITGQTLFYFVHSFYVRVSDSANQMLETTHGTHFDSGICRENIFGVQFHPEKSLKNGMALLRAFSGI